MNYPICLKPGTILLPSAGVDPTTWACVACDQFTSQPEYWQAADQLVGDAPSTLRMILPECYLSESAERIPRIHAAMKSYIDQGAVVPAVRNGYILTCRTTAAGTRIGLVGLLDLETYDYHAGTHAPVRASEQTVESRIPARKAVRAGADLEAGHVLMLCNDPERTLLEPLYARRDTLRKLYDFELMLDGGHLAGYAVESEEELAFVKDTLGALYAALDPADPLLFAVGDGNHSLASAKAWWEDVKAALPEAAAEDHPARYAVVELENIFDPAMHYEAIHRVVFGCDPAALENDLLTFLKDRGAKPAGEGLSITCVYGKQRKEYIFTDPVSSLSVDTLQTFLDAWLKDHPGAAIDYVHEDETAAGMASAPDTMAFLLPVPDGRALFDTILTRGVLPRKTFSMGSAREKRYYMETRRITL